MNIIQFYYTWLWWMINDYPHDLIVGAIKAFSQAYYVLTQKGRREQKMWICEKSSISWLACHLCEKRIFVVVWHGVHIFALNIIKNIVLVLEGWSACSFAFMLRIFKGQNFSFAKNKYICSVPTYCKIKN